MTADDQAKYVRTCAMYEFMTCAASAVEFGGRLNQSLSDRMNEFIEPVREARDWLRHIGQLMILSRPLPNGLQDMLETMENRALEALPNFKALMDEAFGDLSCVEHNNECYIDRIKRFDVGYLN